MKIMTFNVLCGGCEEHGWPERKDYAVGAVRRYMPDVFGLQEAHINWMKIFINGMPEYDYVGVGRDDGKEDGEFSPVFYKKDRFELLDEGTFWISETPDVPSKGWDSACKRVCSYAKLRDKQDGRIFLAANTHLDHISDEARKNGVRMLNEFAAGFDCPIVLTGDFNIPEKTDCYVDMVEGGIFKDVKYAAPETDNKNTFHKFYNHPDVTPQVIDFIFISDGFTAKTYHVADEKIDGEYPSDHHPVVADID